MEDVRIRNTDPTCNSTAYNTANEPPICLEVFSNSAEEDHNPDIAHSPHHPTPYHERVETPDYLLAEMSLDTGGGASVVSALLVSHSLGTYLQNQLQNFRSVLFTLKGCNGHMHLCLTQPHTIAILLLYYLVWQRW